MSGISPLLHRFLQRTIVGRNRIGYDSAKTSLFCSSHSRGVPLNQIFCIHSTVPCLKKSKKELSSEPTKFTSSPANVRSMPEIPARNEYQPIIVSVSLFVFFLYFFLLREENDVDDGLNFGLFERVPQLEEPHLTQAIPRMRDAGVDTREAEKRLKELKEKRMAKEANMST